MDLYAIRYSLITLYPLLFLCLACQRVVQPPALKVMVYRQIQAYLRSELAEDSRCLRPVPTAPKLKQSFENSSM